MPKENDMKKLLFLLPIAVLTLASCRENPKPKLPKFDGASAVLTPEASTLTEQDSKEITTVELSIPDRKETYKVEIGKDCYIKTTNGGFKEIIVKPGSYIKSVSNYKVDRLIIDTFGKKGINFNVYDNVKGEGDAIHEHESEVQPVEPGDGGMVLEYPINTSEWIIKNETKFNKPAFYSVTICLV